jgi:gamma-glutamyltranspeptidase/glutathione hydrolase
MTLRRIGVRTIALLFAGWLFSPALVVALDAARPREAAIASANSLATDAGMEVLAAGGNAFDAAVAVSSTLGLVEPESSGLGGGGFMLLHIAADGREVFIDAREKAPLAATRDMYLDAAGNADRAQSTLGPRAAAIPGLPAGLVHLATNYGRLPLARSLAPAQRLARRGWPIGRKNFLALNARRDSLLKSPGAAALFLRDGKVPELGTRMRNPDYARTLELLGKHGADGFYRGELAQKLVDCVQAAGGLWTLEDFAQYRVVERVPLVTGHRGFRIVTAPPPSSGGISVIEMLNILDAWDYRAMERVPRVHLLAEAMRRAFRDRAIYLGDPDFVKVPVELLTDRRYAAGLRASINPARATPSDLLPGIDAPSERPETSHVSIVDREGNVVAMTQTVNLFFGSTFLVPGTGFMLNDQMDDFSAKAGAPNAFQVIGADANAIAPGKRPLSSMTPTILFGPDRIAALGTPGGSRIVSMVLLGLIELMGGASAQATVDTPRFHHQYTPDTVFAEPSTFQPAEVQALTGRGFTVDVAKETWGNMQVVVWNRHTGAVEAGSDSRWKGVGKATTSSVYR